MTRSASPPAPKARSLAQEKRDFTAEGAPPPGMTGTSTPDVADEGVLPSPSIRSGSHKRLPSGKPG